jgi:predicted RNA-binding Zn ribbon-like protein
MAAMDAPNPSHFELIAGNPAVDFVNTVGGLRPARSREKLNTFVDLLDWATQARLITAAERKVLAREASAQPAAAARALEHARSYREAVHRVFRAVIEGRPTPLEDLSLVETEVRRAWAGRRLSRTEHGVGWQGPDALHPDGILPRLALATAELLTSPAADRLRVCEAVHSGECGWLYLDQTRNHSRRWCEMESCGNRHKARRHYARVRGRA